MRRGRAGVLRAAVWGVACSLGVAAGARGATQAFEYSNSMLSHVQVTPITMLPLNSPPIDGFVPQVVFTLTDEQDDDDNSLDWTARRSTTPGNNGTTTGNFMPVTSAPHYAVAILDSGAQSHLITLNEYQNFNFAGDNSIPHTERTGEFTQPISGASGSETTDISDGVGIYATGFSQASTPGGVLVGNSSALSGQWNTPILSARSNSILPNLIGTPLLSHYQVVISNSNTRRLTVDGSTYRSPDVTFQARHTALPDSSWVRLDLTAASANGVSQDPMFVPDFTQFTEPHPNFADNPMSPAFWASLFAATSGSHTGGSFSNLNFLYDTGASVSVLSQTTAASVGFNSSGPNQSTPDFYVDIEGAGGTTSQAPGFYMNSLSLTTNGGVLTWTHVPMIVLDLPNPTGSGYVPGILGTNLFTDRDLILDTDMTTPWLGISVPINARWSSGASGNWGDDDKWVLGVPDAEDSPANFLSAITAARTVTVDGSYKAGSITFDNANRYTIASGGSGTNLTLAKSTGSATIDVVSGSHTIAVPIVLDDNLAVTVTPAGSVLTISSDVTASGKTITKAGAGKLEMKNLRADGVSVTGGRLAILSGGGTSGTSVVKTTPVMSPIAAIKAQVVAGRGGTGFANGSWNGSGIVSSTAAAADIVSVAVGYVDNSFLPNLGLPSYTSFGGQSVDSSSVLVRYTLGADANLDGRVNSDDLTIVGALYNNPSSGEWFLGDFDFDGICDTDDVTVLGAMYDATAPALSGAQLAAQFGEEFADAFARGQTSGVPEPGGAAVGGLGLALGSMARRKRRRALGM